MKKPVLIAAVAVLTLGLTACDQAKEAAAAASADCSPEGITKTVTELSTKLAELAQSDAAKVQEVQKKMAEIAQEQAGSPNAEKACVAYNGLLATLK